MEHSEWLLWMHSLCEVICPRSRTVSVECSEWCEDWFDDMDTYGNIMGWYW